MLEDVGAPHPAAVPVELRRLWVAELALRPLGTYRLELALGAAHADGDEWRRIVPRARLFVTVTDGLRLYAEGARVPRSDALALEGGATPASGSVWRSTSTTSGRDGRDARFSRRASATAAPASRRACG